MPPLLYLSSDVIMAVMQKVLGRTKTRRSCKSCTCINYLRGDFMGKYATNYTHENFKNPQKFKFRAAQMVKMTVFGASNDQH